MSKTIHGTKMNYVINLQRRDVKHARINVNYQGSVNFIIPKDFSDEDIISLQNKKNSWITKKITELKVNPNDSINIKKGHILLHGENYKIIDHEDTNFIDVENKLIGNKRYLTNNNLEKWYYQYSKNYLINMIENLSKKHKLNYNKLFIRKQKTKWGNCSPSKNISLNWKIILVPDYVKEYIILHELLHTKILNHSQAFWMHLSYKYPNYNLAIDWIKKYGNNL